MPAAPLPNAPADRPERRTARETDSGPATRLAPAMREHPRGRRMRAPVLVILWVLLAFEAVGGLVIFVARLAAGKTPGETLHIVVGLALTLVYAVYQWGHWTRVEPIRTRLDYGLGLLAATFMILTTLTGIVLGAAWWRDRFAATGVVEVTYPPIVSAMHNIGSMLVLAFVVSHLGAVLFRDSRLAADARRAARGGEPRAEEAPGERIARRGL
jgi:hypothetical protein